MTFRRYSALAAAVLAGAIATPASARDDQRLYDIDFVLQSSEGRDRFDDTVKFHWSGQPASEGVQTLSIHTSERKTFLPTRTEKEACDQSFLEALAALRDAARAAGADAVVDIKSLHKNREFRSATQYECRLGYLAAGVTLEGKLAKVSK
jgi:hypothetical protein